MKTKNLVAMKEYFTNVLEDKPIYHDIKKSQTHDFIAILRNEIEKKNQKDKPKGIWKKIWLEAKPIVFNFPKDWELLKTELEAEKAKNKLLSDEIKTYQDLVDKLKEDKKEYIKYLEDKVYGGNYKCGSLKNPLYGGGISSVYICNNSDIDKLPYPCNVLKAVTDCVQIAQELKKMAKGKRKEMDYPEKVNKLIDECDMGKLCQNIADRLNEKQYDPLDVVRLNIKGKLFYFDDKPFSGQVTYEKGKPIQIDKRTVTI